MTTSKFTLIADSALMLMAAIMFVVACLPSARGQDEYVTFEFVDRYYIPGGTGYVVGGTVTWYYYGPSTTMDYGTNYFYSSDYDAVSAIYDRYNNGGVTMAVTINAGGMCYMGQMPVPCRLLY